jgi:hypothetical protein
LSLELDPTGLGVATEYATAGYATEYRRMATAATHAAADYRRAAEHAARANAATQHAARMAADANR